MPRRAVVGLQPYHRMAPPRVMQVVPNAVAWKGVTRLETRGRTRVRGVWASIGPSSTWLKVLAAAEVRNVPAVRARRTGMLRGRGERAKPVVAVSVMRMLRLRFESCE